MSALSHPNDSRTCLPRQVLPFPGARWKRPVFLLFAACWGVRLALLWLRVEVPAGLRWTDGAFLVFGAVASLAVLGHQLPLQNLVGMGLTIGVASLLIETVGIRSGIPFGRYEYSDALGYRLAGGVPWPIPFAWVCLLVTSRGVAQNLLRPWRGLPGHGFRVLGCATLLSTLLGVGRESFASGSRVYSSGTPWLGWLGWFVGASALLALAFPWWIDKRPVPSSPDRQPVVMWLLLQALFMVQNAQSGRWLVVAVQAVASSMILLAAAIPIQRRRIQADP